MQRLQALCLLTAALNVEILISNETPFAMHAVLSRLPPDCTSALSLAVIKASTNSSEAFVSSTADVVLDYSYSEPISLRLLAASEDKIVLGMYAESPPQEMRARLSASDYAHQLAAILHALRFTKGFLISESRGFYRMAASVLTQIPTLDFYQSAVVDGGLSESQVQQIVGRMIKPAGTKIAVFLVRQKVAEMIVRQLQNYHLWTAGYGYVFTEEAGWVTSVPGLLYVTDSVAAQTSNREDFEAAVLLSQLSVLAEVQFSGNPADIAILKAHLAERFSGMSRAAKLLLINIRERAVTVESDSILFPGNATEFPALTRPVLHFSGDYIGLNYDGSAFPMPSAMHGYILAYNDANAPGGLFPNYAIVNHTITPGGLRFNESWARAQLAQHRSDLGLAFHPFGADESTLKVSLLLRELGVQIPTTSVSMNPTLSDPGAFPLFYTMRSGAVALAVVAARFFHVFGWKRTAIIYSDGPADCAFYATFLSMSTVYKVDIVNSAALRQVPQVLETADTLNATITDIFNTTVRIVIIAHPESFLVAERFYDLGARSGDYLICFYYGLSTALYGGPDESSWKRRNVVKGGMMFYDGYFLHAEGRKVLNELIAMDGANYEPIGCVMYDSVALLLHAVDFMLVHGLHFEDGLALMQVIRNTVTVGCSGVLQLEKGTNGRVSGDYSLMNAQYFEDNDTLVLKDVAVYSAAKVQMFTLSNDILFPDGGKTFLDSWPLDPRCPYYQREIRVFAKGQVLGICCAFAVVCGVASFAVLRCLAKQPAISMLTEKKPITLEDGVALVCIAIEFSQLLALAPVLPFQGFETFLDLCAVPWKQIFAFEHGLFWLTHIFVCIFIGVYLLLTCVELFRIEWRMCADVKSWADTLLPVCNNVCYLPAFAVLISNFSCSRSVGDALTDSFLDKDCYQMCWEGRHELSVVASSLLLALYLPAVVYTQPLWQALQDTLRVRAFPSHIAIRLTVHVFLAASQATLRDFHPLWHAYLYTLCLAFYLLSQCVAAPYNYERYALHRVNLWKRLLTFAALIYGSVGMAEMCAEQLTSRICAIAICAVFGVLAVVGVLTQVFVKKYRNLLERKTVDISDIIKFAFTFGAAARRHLYKFKEKQQKHRNDVAASTQTRQMGEFETRAVLTSVVLL